MIGQSGKPPLQRGNDALCRLDHPSPECRLREHSRPAVEQLHDFDARLDLTAEIRDRAFDEQLDQRAKAVSVAIGPALDSAKVPARPAFDHVGRPPSRAHRQNRSGRFADRAPPGRAAPFRTPAQALAWRRSRSSRAIPAWSSMRFEHRPFALAEGQLLAREHGAPSKCRKTGWRRPCRSGVSAAGSARRRALE